MSLTLLRWSGGYAGESILHSILLSNPSLKSNFQFTGLNESGRTEFIANDIESKLGIGTASAVNSKIDMDKLVDELRKLQVSTDHYIIKCHVYDDCLNEFDTIDIQATNAYLPFVSYCALIKGRTIQFNSDPNYIHYKKIIKDEQVLQRYTCFILAQFFLKHNIRVASQAVLNLDDWIGNEEKISLPWDYNKDYRKQWLEKNQQYFPTDKYLEVYTSNRNVEEITDYKIPWYEKYALLVLNHYGFNHGLYLT